jgi:hypothetical protein
MSASKLAKPGTTTESGTGYGGGVVSARQPNIIVFLWDNLGWGEVGCYGGACCAGRRPRVSTVWLPNFGFDEAVWSPRTADEVLWTMQSYFPDGPLTVSPA